jgi:hypothetical protein
MVKSQAKRDAAKSRKQTRKRTHTRVAKERLDPSVPLPSIPIPPAIIADILAKKDLLASETLADHIMRRYLRKNPSLIAELEKPQVMRSAAYEKMKKWVRQELRVLVGMFVLEHELPKLVDEPTAKILMSHRSTAERFDYYPGLYDDLFGAKKPESILDLCAGLNPCSYEYLGCAPTYTAIDVSPQLMAFVDQWFAHKGISGSAFAADITTLTEFPAADTILIFKGTDVLERIRYGFGDVLLDKFRDCRIIVSFATATISGTREISVKKRSWVERWAEQRNRSVRIHDIPGERFYIIE